MTITKAYERLRQLNYLICAEEYDPMLNPNPDEQKLKALKAEEAELTKMVQDFADDPMTQYCGF